MHVGEAEDPAATQFTRLCVSKDLIRYWSPRGFLENYWPLFYSQRLKKQGSDQQRLAVVDVLTSKG